MDANPVWRRLQGVPEGQPLPPARVAAETDVDAPPAAVWETLTAAGGPPWRPPAMVRVTATSERPPVWEVVVDAGPWRLPHRMEVARVEPPRALVLVISGKLNAVVRFDLEPLAGGGRTRLRQRLWFALTGAPVEAALGGAIVEGLTRSFAPSQLRALKTAAEQGG